MARRRNFFSRKLYSTTLIGFCITAGFGMWILGILIKWRSSGYNKGSWAWRDLWKWISGDGWAVIVDFLGSVGTGLISAAIFLVMVDRVLESKRVRDEQQEAVSRDAERLIERLRLGGEVSTVALADLKTSGVLYNGILDGRNLTNLDFTSRDLTNIRCSSGDFSGADLRGCVLVGAILRRSRFNGSRLNGVDLSWADLEGAILDEESLRTAGSLWRCTLPGGARYDGRWNLPGDMAAAQKYGVDLNSVSERAEFYLGS
ncbi:pentapeptide repeat-containing protein [Streptomyces sp. NPDC088350]|uniref:pentapeptide repeat-containing protein n=1 Tax=Streptomyces sp. NPDC088350 TaxID=3365854 RepID=UPI003825DE0E